MIDVLSSYNKYQDAKPALLYNLGMFCSYCEEAYHQQRDLHVEHVQPKGYEENGIKIYAHIEKKWVNFLYHVQHVMALTIKVRKMLF